MALTVQVLGACDEHASHAKILWEVFRILYSYWCLKRCCSVGGLDYGTVRAGAFMGLRILSSLADQLQRQGSYTSPSKPRASNALANGPNCSPIGKLLLTCCTCCHMEVMLQGFSVHGMALYSAMAASFDATPACACTEFIYLA